MTLYRLFADDIGILSAACTLDAVTFDVYIDAEEDTEVLLTDASAFRKLSEGNIYVRCFAYELASKRLSDMLWKLQQVLFLSADRRFAIFLLEESEKRKSDVIRLTHEQMARYMGTAREVVTRLIKYFNQEGWTTSAAGICASRTARHSGISPAPTEVLICQSDRDFSRSSLRLSPSERGRPTH